MKNLAKVSVIALTVLLMTSCASVSKPLASKSSEERVRVGSNEFKIVKFKDSKVFTTVAVTSKK